MNNCYKTPRDFIVIGISAQIVAWLITVLAQSASAYAVCLALFGFAMIVLGATLILAFAILDFIDGERNA